MDTWILALASKHLARVSNPDAIRKFPIFVKPATDSNYSNRENDTYLDDMGVQSEKDR